MDKYLIGTTVKVAWVNSAVTPSAINAAIYNGAETLVDSAAMVESGSGAGQYYHLHTVPNTPGYYVVQTLATISGKPFKRRQMYQAVLMEVD